MKKHRKSKRQLLSFLLVFVMTITMIPAPAFALEDENLLGIDYLTDGEGNDESVSDSTVDTPEEPMPDSTVDTPEESMPDSTVDMPEEPMPEGELDNPLSNNVIVTDYFMLQNALNNAADGDIITVEGTILSEGELIFDRPGVNVTITGGVIQRVNTDDFAMLRISNGTVILENIIFDGAGGNEQSFNNIIRVEAGAALTTKDGTFLKNNATSHGAVLVNGGTFDMEGGYITENTGSFAGAVYVDGGAFNMKDGHISGNTSSFGNTVSVVNNAAYGNGTFNMTGGYITGNTNYSGAVFTEQFGFFIGSGSVINISGNRTIEGADSNVVLGFGTTIGLMGSPEYGSQIGVFTYEVPTMENPVAIATGATEQDKDMFRSDNMAMAGVVYDYNYNMLMLQATDNEWDITDPYEDINAANGDADSFMNPYALSDAIYVNDINGNDSNDGLTVNTAVKTLTNAYLKISGGGEIRVLSNLTTAGETLFNGGKTVTIQSYDASTGQSPQYSAPWQITRGATTADYQILNIISGNVALKNIIFDGTGRQSNSPLVGVSGSGTTLTMESGSKLINNKSSADTGGGIHVSGNATFIMNDGEISGNSASVGGAIRNSSSHTIINGGLITNNSATGDSGAVNVNGGGSAGSFTMTGGIISNNSSPMTGGVRFWGNEFLMTGGQIINNTTNSQGGGIYAESGTITITGGTISHNTGSNDGGGISIKGGTVKVGGGTGQVVIKDNKELNGTTNNIYLANNITIEMLGRLAEDSYIGVTVQYMPAGIGAKVNVATNAQIGDEKHFHSDKSTAAGIIFEDNIVKLSSDAANQDIYVRAGGTGDGSFDNPVGNIEAAFAKIKSGSISDNIILLSDVDYTESSTISSLVGNNKTITIKSVGGARYTVSVNPGSADVSSKFHLDKNTNNNLILENVIFDWTKRGGSPYWGDFFIAYSCSLTLGNGATLNGKSGVNRAVNIRDGGTLIMLPGSEITGFTAGANPDYENYTGIANAGGAVYVCPGGTFDMRGGTISGNFAGFGAAGVFAEMGTVGSYIGVSGILKMSGAPVVTNNLMGTEDLNVYLGNSQTIAITEGGLTAGANIGVSVQYMPTVGNPVAIATNAVEVDKNYFHSDKATEAGVIFDSGEIKLSYDARESNDVVYVGIGGDDSNDGSTVSTAVKTLMKAYEIISHSGEIRVLSDLVMDTAITLGDAKAVTIQSYEVTAEAMPKTTAPWTIRPNSTNYTGSSMVLVTDGMVTLQNIVLNATDSGILARNISIEGINAVVNMNIGTKITGGTFGNGAGVNIKSGTFNMRDGEISGNNATGSAPMGGGIYIANGTVDDICEFNMYSGKISDNSATGTGLGAMCGGVYVNGTNVTFNMYGGEISNNISTGAIVQGGGVYAGVGTFNMYSGTISENKVISANNNANGGGIYVAGTFNIKNGANINITGNTSKDGAENNIYLLNNKTITLEGTSLVNSRIGVYCQTMPTAATPTVDVATGAIQSDAESFLSDDPTKADIIFDGSGKIQLSYDARELPKVIMYVHSNKGVAPKDGSFNNPYETIADAYMQIPEDGTGHEIRVLSPLSVASTTTLSSAKTVTIKSYDNETTSSNTPHTITGNIASGYMLSISGANSKVTLENITLDAVDKGCTVIGVLTGAELTINEGTTITGGSGVGGVYVTSDNSKVTMNGGKITENTASGIYLGNGANAATLSTFIMNGGEISNNTIGGVHMLGPGTSFTMTGGEIKENKDRGVLFQYHTNGGGLGTLNISGTPVIKDNVVGNIHARTAIINITDPLTAGAHIGVSPNVWPNVSGAKVAVTTGSAEEDYLQYFHSDEPTKAGVIFDDSTKTIQLSYDARDKVVYVKSDGNDTTGSGSFSKPFATLKKAYETIDGEGEIRVLSNLALNAQTDFNGAKSVTIQSYSDATNVAAVPHTITGNISAGYMLSISGTSSKVTLENITLDADSSGSTVIGVLKGAELTINEGTIITGGTGKAPSRSSSSYAGGVYVTGANSKVTMNGGKITGNTTNGVGLGNGTGASPVSTFTMNGGEISGNTTNGVHMLGGGASFTMTDGEVTGNKGYGVAFQYHVNGGSFGKLNLSGTPVIKDNVVGNVHARKPLIKITAPLTDGAYIGVTPGAWPSVSGAKVVVTTRTAMASYLQYFHSDKPAIANAIFDSGRNEFLLSYNDRTMGETFYVHSSKGTSNDGSFEHPFVSIDEAFDQIKTSGYSNARIILLSDSEYSGGDIGVLTGSNKTITITSETGKQYTVSISPTDNLTESKWDLTNNTNLIFESVILDSASRSGAPTDGEFLIGDGSTLMLGNDVILQGKPGVNRAVNINSGGTLIMSAGSKITGFTAGANTAHTADAGGAIYICSGGTFDMQGGTISGNSAEAGGAGVFAENGTTFKMSGAPVVTGNSSSTGASNVYLENGQTIDTSDELTNGASIDVYVETPPTDTDPDPKTVTIATGALSGYEKYFYSDKPTEAGISFNNTDGEVMLDVNAKIDVVEFYVSDRANGNGTFANPFGSLQTAYNSIPKNVAAEIRVLSDLNLATQLTFDAAKTVTVQSYDDDTNVATVPYTITGNISAGYMLSISGTISNVTLKNITLDADSRGSTVIGVLSGAELTIGEGTTITGGTGKAPSRSNISYAGGVYITGANSKVTMTDGKIVGNTTNGVGLGNGTGGSPVSTFTMNGGEISGNTTNGVHMLGGGASFTMTSGKITENKGYGVAFQYHVNGGGFGKLNVSGTPVIKDNVAGNVHARKPLIDIIGQLDAGADIGVTPGSWPSVVGARVPVTTNTGNDSNKVYFHSDKPAIAGIILEDDVIKLQYLPTASVSTKVNANGKGEITVTPTGNKSYALLDKNGNIVTPFNVVDKDGEPLTGDVNGWYTDSNIDGTITFKPLDILGEYEVVFAVTPTTETPEEQKDEGIPCKFPPVGDNAYAVIVPTTATDPVTATIIIDPANNGLEYAVLNQDGTAVERTWQPVTTDGKVEFAGLAPNTIYKIVSKPKDGIEDGELTKADDGVNVKTPPDATFKQIEPKDVERAAADEPSDTDIITIDPTVTTQDYALVDEEGNVIGWKTGTGGPVSFDELDPDKTYKVVTRTNEVPASLPDTPINIYPRSDTDVLGEDNDTPIAAIVGEEPKTVTITLNPTDTELEYAVVGLDENGNPASATVWKPGAGETDLTFTGLIPDKDYKIVTRPKGSQSPTSPEEASVGSGFEVHTPKADIDVPTSSTTTAQRENVNDNADKITLSGTNNNQDYVLVPFDENGDLDWENKTDRKVGTTGNTGLVFDGIVPEKTYQVFTRNINPSLPVAGSIVPPLEAVNYNIAPKANDDGQQGYLDVETTTGTYYAILNIDGTSVDGLEAYNEEGVQLTTTNDWYNADPANGKITFKPLDIAKQYKIVSAANTTAEPSGQSAKTFFIPPVGYNAYATIVPDNDTPEDATVTLTIDKSVTGVHYAVTDGDSVVSSWQTGNGSKLMFTDLNPDKKYKIVAVHGGTIPNSETINPGDQAEADAKAPSKYFIQITSNDITRDNTTITISPTDNTQEYALIDESGNVIEWKSNERGTSPISFSVSDSEKIYNVITREKITATSILPSLSGTPIKAYPLSDTDGLAEDDGTIVAEIVGDTPDETITITLNPTDDSLDYAVVELDEDGNPIGTIEWKIGTPDEGLEFAGLIPGEDYKVVTRIHDNNQNPEYLAEVSVSGGIVIHTPNVPASITAQRENVKANEDKVTLSSTEADREYVLVPLDENDKPNWVGINDWKTGTGNDDGLEFGVLNPETYYLIFTRGKAPVSVPVAGDTIAPLIEVVYNIAPKPNDNGQSGYLELVEVEPESNKFYTIRNIDGTQVTGLEAYDKNGTKLTATNGWYGEELQNGSVIFKPLDIAKEYRIVSAESTTTAPAAQHARTFFIPPVGNNAYSDGTSITINPSVIGVHYAVVDTDNKVVAGGWKTGNGDKLTFTGLDNDTSYKIVAVPGGEIPTSEKVTPGEQAEADSKTPSADFTEIDPKDVTRTGEGSITINPTISGQEYAIVDPDTVGTVTEWQSGTGNELTLSVPNSDKEYEVITREPGTLRSEGVTALSGIPETSLGGNDKSITINPTDEDTWYAVVDEEGKIVGSNPDGWKAGTGEELQFSGLDEGTEYKIVTTPKEGETKPTVREPIGGGTEVTTAPEAVIATRDRDADDAGKDQIAFPTETGNEYAVVEKGQAPDDGDWMDGTGTDITVDSLDPAKEYEVFVRVKDVEGIALTNVTEVPVIPAVELPGIPETTPPTVIGGGDKSITINPTDEDTWYAVVDEEGKIVGSNPDGWKAGTGEELQFSGLDEGTEYKIVTTPKEGETKPTVREPISGGTEVATAPEAVIATRDRDADDAGKDQITFETETDNEYAVVEKGQTPDDGDWMDGTGTDITFDSLDPTKEYEVFVRVKDVEGIALTSVTEVPVIPAIELPGIPETTPPTVIGGGDKSITINPTDEDTWYAVVDEEGKIVGDNPDGWKVGTGEELEFSGLDEGTEYKIVTTPKDGETKPTVREPIGGGTAVTTAPEAVIATRDRDADYADKDKITFPTETGKEYAVVEKGATDSAVWSEGYDGDRTLGNLNPNKEYEVLVRIKDANDGNVYLTKSTNVPRLAGNFDATGKWNSENNTSVTLNPTDADFKYALVDADGNIAPGTNWQDGNSSSLTFNNLPEGTKYKAVTVPKDETPTAEELKEAKGKTIVTPTKPVDAKSIKTTDSTITINPTIIGKSYNIVDPNTGEVVGGDWKSDSDGGKVEFTGLTPGKVYEVVAVPNPLPTDTSENDVLYNPGTPAVTKFTAITAIIVDADNSNITVKPTDIGTKYAVVDKDGEVIGDWKTGIGNEPALEFTGLKPGTEYKVISVPMNTPDTGYPISGHKDNLGVSVVTPVLPVDSKDISTGYNFIRIKPANINYEYALIGPDGKFVDNAWKSSPNGTVTFRPLKSGTTYEIVARLIANETNTGAERPYVVPGTPATTKFETITGTYEKSSNTSSVTAYPTYSDDKYAVVDSGGNVVSDWKPGTGGELEFTGLTPGGDYNIIKSTNGVLPGNSVASILAPTVTPDNSDIVKGETSITIKNTDTSNEYAIVDPVSGNIILDRWTKGTGNDLIFAPLALGKEYEIIVRKDAADTGKTSIAARPGTEVTTEIPVEVAEYTIVYNSNGGSGTVPVDTKKYLKGATLVVPNANQLKRTNYAFIGWSDGVKTYQPGDIYTIGETNVVFRAQWKALYDIKGRVVYDVQDNTPVPNAEVLLKQGAAVVGETTTDSKGNFSFAKIDPGIYNIVVNKDGVTITQQVDLTTGSKNSDIRLPNGKTNSVVEIGEKTLPLVVDNLDKQFDESKKSDTDGLYTPEDEAIVEGQGAVELKFIAVQQDEETVDPVDKGKISAVNDEINMTVALFFDFSVEKSVKEWDTVNEKLSDDSTVTNIPELPSLIEILIPLPFELQGMAKYSVSRVHGDEETAELLPPYNGGNEEGFRLNQGNGKTVSITIFIKKFSTIAIGHYAESTLIIVKDETQNKTTVVNGGSVTLTAPEVNSDSVTYQWYRKTSNGDELIVGATYKQHIVTPSASASYYVVVTSTSGNVVETVTSGTLSVTVISGGSDPGTSNPGGSNPGTSNPGTSNPGTSNPGGSNPDNNGAGNVNTDNGSGTVSTSGSINLAGAPGGKISANPLNPVYGELVTVIVTPNAGNIFTGLAITTSTGQMVTYKKVGDNTYTFVMPYDKLINISPVFAREDNSSIGDVSRLLITDRHIAYVSGRGNDMFVPNNNMTRAEVAAMFYNLLRNKDVSVTKGFDDVSDEAWYTTQINALASLDIISGYTDGSFRPNNKITRAEFATIAVRFAEIAQGDIRFNDVSGTHWAYAYINTAANYGWVSGVGEGRFEPDRNITRAEAVSLVNRMLKREADKAYIDNSTDLVNFTDINQTHWAYYQIIEAANTHDHVKTENGEGWK